MEMESSQGRLVSRRGASVGVSGNNNAIYASFGYIYGI